MTLSRRVETFVAGYIGFQSEATVMTDAPTTDIGIPALTTWAVTNRTQQYLDFLSAPTVKMGASAGAATAYTTFTYQALGAIFTASTALGAGNSFFVTSKYIPMYFLKGARGLANNEQTAKIDTTGSGDTYMNAVPGRPDATISFSLVAGAKITLKDGTITTIENRLKIARRNGEQVVISLVDDTSDPLLPRDVYYGFIGSTNKTRAMNSAVEIAIDSYIAVPDNGQLPTVAIDKVA